MPYPHRIKKEISPQRQIISASRRTDIPAFYTSWLLQKIEEGWVDCLNPYNGKLYRVSLRPEEVAGIVFWSKDYRPLLPYLPLLDQKGYRFYCHFTITGLPRLFERRVPHPDSAVKVFQRLAEQWGPQRILWRYDPIILSSLTPPEYHLQQFERLCASLVGYTQRCYFSFVHPYGKVKRNLALLEEYNQVELLSLSLKEKQELALKLAEIGSRYGISLYACCQDFLVQGPIQKAECVSASLIRTLWPDSLGEVPQRPSREQCGCSASKDIGAYNTCPHGCYYCYANSTPELAFRRWQEYQISNPR